MRHTKQHPDDFLALLRRPHGVLTAVLAVGIILWALWTLMTLR